MFFTITQQIVVEVVRFFLSYQYIIDFTVNRMDVFWIITDDGNLLPVYNTGPGETLLVSSGHFV